jgi:hypothetical protein
MDRLQSIEKIKVQIKNIMIEYPKTIKLIREGKNLVIELNYPYGYDYKDYYKENIFSKNGKVEINLEESNNNFQDNINDLLKVKKFLKYKFNKTE